MVKKLVLQMECDQCTPPNTMQGDITPLLLLNQSLLSIVTAYKDKITDYYKNKLWDKYKKVSNEYEHVFFSPNAASNVSLYNPVSRSFFKLWEILIDYEDMLRVHDPSPMTCVFLAEGPGGFFEAFHKRRQELHPGIQDVHYGITLRSNNNRNIPDWKTQKSLPITISYGKDGTGNLYHKENLSYFADHVVGRHSCDFITADGGFDFSSNFNNQEEQSLRLVASEVLACTLLQKTGGSFLLKLYDCFNDATINILHILSRCYTTLHFIKPLTSRPANSERYVLCMGFKGTISKTDEAFLVDVMECRPEQPDIPFDFNVVYHIVLYNLYYTIRQVFYIQRTINYINFFRKQTEDVVMNSLLEKHHDKSKKWCLKYNIPIKDQPPLPL